MKQLIFEKMKFLTPIYLVLAFAAIEAAAFSFDKILKTYVEARGRAVSKKLKPDNYFRKYTKDGAACHEKGWCAQQCCFAFNDLWNCPCK